MENQGLNLVSFLSGLAVGAVVALLVAPDSGKNTRNKISKALKEGEEKLKEAKKIVEQKIQEAKLAVSDGTAEDSEE